MTSVNLLTDLQNSHVQYQSSDGELGDALSGSVYRNTYSHCFITNPACEFLFQYFSLDRSDQCGYGFLCLFRFCLMLLIILILNGFKIRVKTNFKG
jgi:hypothetical protein